MAELKIITGGTLQDDAAAFLDAWHRAERGELVAGRVLAFESLEGLVAHQPRPASRLTLTPPASPVFPPDPAQTATPCAPSGNRVLPPIQSPRIPARRG